jgi:predicted regulator of Ras-like GTPase activity (Roadblock/LC7/MglB family)
MGGAVERLSRVPGVLGAMIVEVATGVSVVEEVTDSVAGPAVAALAAALYRRTEQAASAAGFGNLDLVHLEAEHGHVLIAGTADFAVIVLTDPRAQLGMVRIETTRALETLR